MYTILVQRLWLLYEETKPLDSGKPIIYSDYRFKGEVNDNPFKSLNDDTDTGVNGMGYESYDSRLDN